MCTSPRNASFHPNGAINFSKEITVSGIIPFQVPCGKCIECLLERARDWSIRCVHEATMHENNCFITLTYSDEHLPPNGKLLHSDFQSFMNKIRKRFGEGISFFMCGEYGEQTHRPHYHACLFGVDFSDKEYVRENEHGDQIWSSETLTTLWGLGHTELGSVTQKSAGYVARYIIKKQSTKDDSYQKMSRKNTVGKRFIEKWYKDVFVHAKGCIILSDGTKTKVPRYYEKWLKKYKLEEWLCYITNIKPINSERMQKKQEQEYAIYIEEVEKRKFRAGPYKSPLARKREILKTKQKQLKRNYL